jgi:hypothetical protein
MKLFSKISLALAVLAFIGLTSSSAHADAIVLVTADNSKLVPPLAALNLQHSGNSRRESGSVSWSGTIDLSAGDISAGPHQHTVSFTELGLAQANDLRILFNINEPNGRNKAPITIDTLVLTAYDQDGNSVFTASLVGPVTLNQFKHAQGSTSDYMLGLDAEAAARLQAALDNDPALRLGLSASLSNVDGGPERFRYAGTTAGPVPEPATIVLFGTSLAGLAAAVRRRRKAAAAILANQQETD